MKQNTRQVLATAARSTLDPQQAFKFPMNLEPLEDRRLMTAVPGVATGPISLSGGTLTLSGNPSTGNQLRVDLGGTGSNKVLQADVNGTFESFSASKVKHIRITGGSGDDYVYVDPRVGTPTSIVTGDGNDTIRTGNGHASVNSGPGNDVIFTHGKNNSVNTGTGSDKVVTDAAGNEIRAGGLSNTYLYTPSTATNTKATAAKTTKATTATKTSVASKATTTKAATEKATAAKTTKTVAAKTTAAKTTTAKTTTAKKAPTTTTTKSTTPVVTKTGTSPTTTKAATPTTTKTTTPTTTASTTPTTTTTSTTTAAAATPTVTPTTTVVAKPVAQPVATPTATKVIQAVTVASGTVAQDLARLTAPITPGGTTSDGKPVAELDILPGIRQTGMVLNVDGMNSKVGTGTCITTQYAWDFGDTTGAHDTMTGYGAAHVYDKAGTYTVTLKVTNQNGQVSIAQGQVTIAASTRKQVFVDAVNGSDSNTGTSASAPLKTAAAAFAKLGDNTEILMHAGQSFSLAGGISIHGVNILIGRYGTGSDPTIMRAAGFTGQAFQTFDDAEGITIQHLQFDSPNAVATNAAAPKTGVSGIYLRGSNLTVRNCTFLNIDEAINSAGNPGGYLVSDNSAPLVTGLRAYMVWAQGSRGTIVGNYVANSTREHCIRLVDASQVTVEDNNLTNLGRTSTGDTGDIIKGCIEMQMGQYGWIAGNHVTDGDIRVGPRGATGIGGETASSSTDWCVIQDNQLTDTFLYVQSGAHHAMFQNNVIVENDDARGDGTIASSAINVNGTDKDGRTSSDITFRNNTAVQSGVSGNFIRVNGWCSGVSLSENLYVAPNLQITNNGSCAVFVNGKDLSCFSKIAENVWPSQTATLGKWGSGGVNFIGTDLLTSSDYVTPEQWLAQSQVQGDMLDTVTTSDLTSGTYQLTVKPMVAAAASSTAVAAASSSGITVGASLARAA